MRFIDKDSSSVIIISRDLLNDNISWYITTHKLQILISTDIILYKIRDLYLWKLYKVKILILDYYKLFIVDNIK